VELVPLAQNTQQISWTFEKYTTAETFWPALDTVGKKIPYSTFFDQPLCTQNGASSVRSAPEYSINAPHALQQ
jgi:hypothetical protein